MRSLFFPHLRLVRSGFILCVMVARIWAADTPAAAPEKAGFIYRLTTTDRVRVSIFQEDDLAEIARIDARGDINLKLVGDLHISGLTVNEAQHAIEQAYREGRYLRNPQASVVIEEYAPREGHR